MPEGRTQAPPQGGRVWPRIPLGELSEITAGLTLGSEPTGDSSVVLPYLRVANVQDGHLDLSEVKTVRVLRSQIDRYRLFRGDVLLTEGGDFDKVGRGAVWNGQIPLCLHQNHIFRVRCDARRLLSGYLAAYVRSYRAKQYFLGVAKRTTTIASIDLPQLQRMPIPLPSLNDQQSIVELLNVVDKEAALVKQVLVKLRSIEWGTLSDLITAGVRDIPQNGWVWRRVEEIGEVQLGRQRSPAHDAGPWMGPYLRVANVMDGYIDYSDVLRMNFMPNERTTYELRHGDILLNEGQTLELVGRSAIFDGPPQMFFQNTLIRFRPRFTLPEFARAVFKYWLETGEFTKVAKQTTSIAHLGADRFAAMRFPLAPRKEEQRIVNVLSALADRVRAEQSRLAKLDLMKEGLMEDLLTGKVRIPQ